MLVAEESSASRRWIVSSMCDPIMVLKDMRRFISFWISFWILVFVFWGSIHMDSSISS